MPVLGTSLTASVTDITIFVDFGGRPWWLIFCHLAHCCQARTHCRMKLGYFGVCKASYAVSMPIVRPYESDDAVIDSKGGRRSDMDLAAEALE